MALSGNRMAQQEMIVVTINQVDLTNRLAHVIDKYGAEYQMHFRQTPGGIFHVPAQGEIWAALRTGHQWYLSGKLDSLDEHRWATDNMQAGDTRLSGSTVHVIASGVQVNRRPFSATVRDFFFSPVAGFATVTLTNPPVVVESIQVFLNGLLADGNLWDVHQKTITFKQEMAAGYLQIFYQTNGATWGDFGMAVGRSVISGAESFIP